MDAKRFSNYRLSRGQICVQLALKSQKHENDTDSDVSDVSDDRDPEWKPPKKKKTCKYRLSNDSDTDSEISIDTRTSVNLECLERDSEFDNSDHKQEVGDNVQTVTGSTTQELTESDVGIQEIVNNGFIEQKSADDGVIDQNVKGDGLLQETAIYFEREEIVTDLKEHASEGGIEKQILTDVGTGGQTIESDDAMEQTTANEHNVSPINTDNESVNGDVLQETQKSFKKREPKSQRQKHQLLRMKGKAYKGMTKNNEGKYEYSISKAPKVLGPSACISTCQKRTKCKEFSETQRSEIFTAFWEMDWNQKKVFVSTLIDSKEPEKKKTENQQSRRKRTLIYHLKKDEIRLPVCKHMFLSTLGIGEWMMLTWTKESKGGTHKSSVLNATPSRAKVADLRKRERVEEFIRSLPKLPSHYCRSSTNRLYLQPDIQSFSELYRQYKVSCGDEAVGERTFRSVLNDMNVSIFHPKKDQCDICCGHDTDNIDESVYTEHIQRKVEARAEKSSDKEAAIAGDGTVIAVDLQAVLLAPSLKASAMYYKCKLACHNYTVFDLATRDVCCYFWHEGEGELTANSFASCLYDYINRKIRNSSKLTIYSDGCTYQNRNITMANTLLSIAVKKGLTIYQKILEKGHTQMECDCVHSTIEKGMRNRPIHVPADYVDIMKNARLTQPYEVKYVDHTFFKDFTSLKLYNSIRPGTKVGDKCVTDLRVLKYSPDGKIQFKISYSEREFQEFHRRSKGSGNVTAEATPLYAEPLKIKQTKFKHLMDLKSVIPRDYHGFYDQLHHD